MARLGLLLVLTLNVGDVPVLRAHLRQRMAAVASAAKDAGYGVAALQEAWRGQDVQTIAERAELPYAARLDDGFLGGGLTILSRYPIAATRQILFTCRPSSLRPFHGESLSNEGALMARVQTPSGALDVYDTQLIADSPSARYVTLRLTQIFELSEMIVTESAGRPFLLLGDLNMGVDAPAYRVLVDLLGLADACVKHGEDECGLTAEEEGERLDHILLPEAGASAASAEAAFAEPIPGTNLPYSDHEGVSAELAPGIFKARLYPDPRRRLEALMMIESAIDRMVATLENQRAQAVWIPVYGFAAALRYDRELSRLAAVRARVETQRIVALGGGGKS